jgi:PAS domain S-box-containing protein
MTETPGPGGDRAEPLRHVEAALRESDARFRALLHYSSDLISVVDADGIIRYANAAAERILGYRPEEFLGTPVEQWLHPEDVARMRAALARRVARPNRPPAPALFRLGRRDGSWCWLEAATTGVIAEAGVEGFVISGRDVTERAQADQRLRRMNAELERRVLERTAQMETVVNENRALLERERAAHADAEAGRTYLAVLAEASALFASALDLEATLRNVARAVVPAFADGCGVALVEGGDAVRHVAVAHTDARKEAALLAIQEDYPFYRIRPDALTPPLRRGEPFFAREIGDAQLAAVARDAEHLRLLRALGPTSLLVLPLMRRERLLGALSFLTTEPGRQLGPADIERAQELARRAALAIDNARLYREARQALEEARAALGVRDEFLSIASHELLTPITALKGQLQLVGRRLARGELAGADEFVRLAEGQVDRLATLVDTLLDVSRLADGRFALDAGPVALGPLLDRVVALARAASDPPRPIELTLPDGSPLVLGDADRLELVFVNLLENARKYAPAERPIRVRLAADGERVTVAVRDEGAGIPPEEQDRIFDRFRRASNVDLGIAGMGLGLYISREIVRAHGGEIRVESAPDVGSTFTVALPRMSDRGEDAAGA